MYEEYVHEVQKKKEIRRLIGIVPILYMWGLYKIIAKKFKIKGATIGEATCISNRIRIKSPKNLTVGNSTLINEAILDSRGGLVIGSHCILNDGVEIITASHNYHSIMWETTYDKVTIEDYAWLATGCKILPGVTVGRGAVIGTGSIVTSNVPSMAICVGVPAKVKGYRNNVHNGFPTEKLVGADFIHYINAMKKNKSTV